MIDVCAAVIGRVDLDGCAVVLVARRTRPAELRGLWEFPGGKLEPGETPKACLVRELQEELLLDIDVGEQLGVSRNYDHAPDGIRLTAYAARLLEGSGPAELVDGTHDRFAWVDRDELADLPLAPLDIPLVVNVVNWLRDLPNLD